MRDSAEWTHRCAVAMLSSHLTPLFSPPPGGPLAKDCSDPSNLLNTGGASNFPLRGGKIGIMEGGIRLNAFASGGLIPPAQRGTTYEGWLHLADFYATACALAGVDPTDHRAAAAGLPPIDSLDFSAVLLGTNMTSPRTEIAIGSSDDSDHTGNTIVAGLIDADGWKLIIPGNVDPAFYQGPVFRASGAGGQLQQPWLTDPLPPLAPPPPSAQPTAPPRSSHTSRATMLDVYSMCLRTPLKRATSQRPTLPKSRSSLRASRSCKGVSSTPTAGRTTARCASRASPSGGASLGPGSEACRAQGLCTALRV